MNSKGRSTARDLRRQWLRANGALATGVFLACAPLGFRWAVPANAQEPPPPDPHRSSEGALGMESHSFDIAPGPLADVAKDVEDTTKYEISVASRELGEVHSPGVRGVHRLRSALDMMLRGTAARYVFVSDTEIRLELDPITELIDVVADPVLSAPIYTEPIRETPQTLTVIDRGTIESQGATSLRDVLRNVTGLTVNAGEGGVPAGDNLTLRGFSARNDIFIDGTRDLGPQSRDPFNVEQVEVVKGPQSAFTGRGSSGGSINMFSKTARLGPFANFGLIAGTDPIKRGTADLNAPIGFLGSRTAFRLNLMGHDSGMAGRDVVNFKRWGAAPTLTFGLGSPTRLVAGYSMLSQDNISDYGIPWVPGNNNALAEYRNRPAPVPRNTFYGFRDRDHEDMESDSLTLRFEHEFGDSLMLRNQFRYGRSTRDSIATPPRFNSPDSTDIKREMRSWITEDDIYDNRADLVANFGTGGAEHSLVTGFNLTREGNIRRYRSAPNQIGPLLNPDPDEPYLGEFTLGEDISDAQGDSQSLYMFDTVRLGKRLQANGGLRLDRFQAGGSAVGWFRGPDGWERRNVALDQTESMLSLRGGLVFNPTAGGSMYVSYGSSLNPSLEGLTYGFRINNLGLDPEKTYTVEGGSKWDLFNDRLLVSGALFQVNKTNARTPGILPDDPPTVLEGSQRVRGAEVSATGHVTPAWMVFAGYTFMDSEIVESNSETQIGNRFPQTPANSLNVWTTYQFPKFVTLGGGLRHIGERFSNTSNTRRVDPYWTLDLMAEIRVHRSVSLRLNAFNLTDAYYFDRIGGGHVVPGPARSMMAGLNLRF